jgi:hypothetical protein
MAGVNHEFDPLFDYYGRLFNVDPALGKTVFHLESGGNAGSRDSPQGAQGGMQIIPSTARGLGISDPRDINQAIYGGMKYLREGLDATGTPQGALAYYHGGPDRSQWGPRTAAYVANGQSYYPSMSLTAYAPPRPDATSAKAPATKEPTADDILKSYEQQDKAAPSPVMPSTAPEGVPMMRIAPPGEKGSPKADDILRAYETADAAAPPSPAVKSPAPEADQTVPSEYPTMPYGTGAAGAIMPGLVTPTGNALMGAARGFVQGAERGRLETQPLLTPYAEDALQGMWAGRNIYAPAAHLFDQAHAGVNALVSGVAGAVGGGTEAAGIPGFGRDINMLMAVAPMAHVGTGVPSVEPAVSPPSRPQFVSERFAPDVSQMNPRDAIQTLLQHDVAENPPSPDRGTSNNQGAPNPLVARPGETGLPLNAAEPSSSLPGIYGGTPDVTKGPFAQGGAAGADVTGSPIPIKTPAQRITDLEKSVLQTAEERAGPQLHDPTQYVEGIPPRLLASTQFTPLNALDEKVAIGSDPAFRKEIEANARARNEGMTDLLRTDAMDANALDEAHQARSEVSPQALGVFEGEKPVDAGGLVNTIQDYLKGPDGKQAAVRNTLNNVLDSLHDADGNIEKLPSVIYGARKNLTDLLKKGVKGTSDVADDVRASKHILTNLLPQFDETISGGAPKFASEYLPQYHEMSQPINQMEFLQKYQTGAKKITDGDGYLIPNKVQKMLDDILQGVRAPGVNPAKSLSDQQIQNIINVRNELAAGKLRDRLAAVKGSDSFQQFMRVIAPTPTPIKAAATGAATLGAHGLIAASPLAGYGNAALGTYQNVVKPALQARRARKAEAAIAERKAQLLTPSNPLQNPPEP